VVYYAHDRRYRFKRITTIDSDIYRDDSKESEVISMATKKKAAKKTKKATKKKK
jgi:hypothetical protein